MTPAQELESLGKQANLFYLKKYFFSAQGEVSLALCSQVEGG